MHVRFKNFCVDCVKEKMTELGYIAKSHGMRNTRFYKTWENVKRRSSSPSSKYYKLGIRMSKRWKRFENFKKDMYKSYIQHSDEFTERQTTIDRINNFIGYSKDNCRWATYKVQNNNKRIHSQITGFTEKGMSPSINATSNTTFIINK